MTDYFGAGILARTYFHRVSAWRPLSDGGEKPLCEAAECALSRSAHTSAPAPADERCVLPEASYRFSLFTRPGMWFRLGDRLEVTDEAGRVFHGWASDSVVYPSHCVTVMEVWEVLAPEGEGLPETEETPDSGANEEQPLAE